MSRHLQAERDPRELAVTLDQRRELKRLSLIAGVEMPYVFSKAEAEKAIEALRETGDQRSLTGFREAVARG